MEAAQAAIANVQARIAEIESKINGGPRGASVNSLGQFNNALSNAFDQYGLSADGKSVLPGSLAAGGVGGLEGLLSGANGASGEKAVAIARKFLGVPYVWGGTSMKGVDCSGLVQLVFKEMGINLPRGGRAQSEQGVAIPSLAQAKPGDLVSFGRPVDHIGIYIGNNKMIVAPKPGDVVKIQTVYETPSKINRVIPETAINLRGASGVASSNAATQSLAYRIATGNYGSSGSGSIPSSLQSRFDSLFVQAGNKHGISPTILAAVAKQESGFNPSARSPVGASGLMQFMPATARGMGVNPLDPASAVDGAARMLTDLKRKFGSIELALAGYNAGPGAVQKYNGIPPYRETQNYVKRIMSMTGGIR
ncbi:MAG: transglycosylase SLT domain-containing protein [Parvularcula sp.]|nr:transglycosylase SLT domain-containing protein [Parvularcula sp.]